MTNTDMINLPNGLHEAQQIIIAQREQIEALQKRVKAALERLDASLFTNAEHQQAKAILRATGGQDNE